jgi:hypothetical protein
MDTEQSKIQGEKFTGYEPPAGRGLFQCQNCEYFRNRSCGQDTMMEKSKLPKTENGRVVVEPEACCSFFHFKSGPQKTGHWLAGKR